MSKKISSLEMQLSSQMTKKCIIMYICILFLLCALLFPILYSTTSLHAKKSSAQISEEIENMQHYSLEYIDGLIQLPILNELLLAYEKEPNSTNSSRIELYLQSYTSVYSDLLMLYVETPGGTIFHSYKFSDNTSTKNIFGDPRYQALKKISIGTCYFPVSQKTFQTSLESGKYFSTMAISKNYQIQSKTYTISGYFRVDSFLDSANIICENSLNDFFVIQNGENYFSASPEKLSFFSETDETLSLSGHISNKMGLFFYNKLYNSECYVVGFISWMSLFSDLFEVLIIITIVCASSAVFYTLSLRKSIRHDLLPLSQLADVISSYSIGQVIDIPIKTGNELEILAGKFQNMMEKIAIQINDIRVFERENAVTQFRLLTTQIDPHFIYNTMNIISILAKRGETNSVIEVNSNLISILQQRLNTKVSIFETIKAELKTLQQYEVIMDYRYANNVEIVYNIDPNVINRKILKNILQPLVENAYLHGLSSEDGEYMGVISLTIRLLKDRITIIVSDNGRGINSEKLRSILSDEASSTTDHPRIHIGLQNIYLRLNYIYKDSMKMDIQSTTGKGTTVTISFPDTSLSDEKWYLI